MTKPNSYKDFLSALDSSEPRTDWHEALKALKYDAEGNWEASHNIAQELHTNLGSWIHAYLHRKEGDEWNAGYWYQQANKPFPKISFKEELKELVEYIISSKDF